MNIKSIGFTAAFGASIFLTSCEKDLELKNEFGLTPTNAFTDLAAYSRQLSGVYGTFASPEYYNGYVMVTDILSDDCYETIESLVNFNQVHNWLYDASDRQRTFFTSMWRDPYNAVLQANYIISGIDAFKNTSEGFYNRVLGQALAPGPLPISMYSKRTQIILTGTVQAWVFRINQIPVSLFLSAHRCR